MEAEESQSTSYDNSLDGRMALISPPEERDRYKYDDIIEVWGC